jgi:hypothetical protein
MTNQEILTKAIEKAITAGWSYWPINYHDSEALWSPQQEIKYHFDRAEEADPNGGPLAYWANIIFNHDFAKALWGDWPIGSRGKRPEWQYHLQQMVVADDPIKYLGENI